MNSYALYSRSSFCFFRRTIHDYNYKLSNHTQKNYFIVKHSEKHLCPECGNRLYVRDTKKRTVKDGNGTEYIFSLRQLYCRCCQVLHTEIPDCIYPHKHYYKSTITSVIGDKCDYFAGDNKTIYRWKNL